MTRNYLYALSSFNGDDQIIFGTEIVGTGLPNILEPTYHNGELSLKAAGSLIKSGAKLIVNTRYKNNLKLDSSKKYYQVSADQLSSYRSLTLKQLIKKHRPVELIILNKDGSSSPPYHFTRQ